MRQSIRMASRAMIFDPLQVMYPGIVCIDRRQVEKWLDRHCDSPRWKLVYRPPVKRTDREGMQAEAEFYFNLASNIRNVHVFCDEIDTFGRGEDEPDELFALLNWGRIDYVSLTGTVRRPQVKVPRDWATETTIFSIFSTVDPTDCSFLERRTRIPANEFAMLQKFEYWEWQAGKSEKKKLENPYDD